MTVSEREAQLVSDERPVKERLLESATELMAERGFAGVSVREICTAAGTSINMLHHYYGSKQGMYDAIIEQFSDEVFAVPMRLLDTAPKSADDVVSRMELLFDATAYAYVTNRSVLLVVIREQASPSALPRYQAALADFIAQAQAAGFVRAGVDASMVVGFMLDRILNQVQMAPWITEHYGTDLLTDEDYRRRWTRANLDVFLHGVVA